jgi:guanyl-specific ribonuclease Sa
MRPLYAWIVLALALVAAWAWWREPSPVVVTLPPPVAAPDMRGSGPVADADALPAQARETLRRIRDGGPFPHRQDGGVFRNREGLLPQRPRGWYREYTVETPGSRDRGARRIVAGGDPPGEFWYTDDHYRSFRRIDAAGGRR